ncbi:PEGA domain-containing protein [Rummeliibacillus stabekisii]|uniref:PEGA domain-containing protein n=1 Tax=Rummeliibacillus stabekisii TaxID=241244 RepID=UPI0020409E48|nr:PEGA domain-containing protein [Rummeliibacillus stabekisii]MCM3318022.1 PEGA domain-containing protein [Rummeliibacillus stabekisii]
MNKKSIVKATALSTAIIIGTTSAAATMTINSDTASAATSAATTYAVKSGKLVVKSTGKAATGYVTYKSVLYNNGAKFTGLYKDKYYKSGALATGTYKSKYYSKGSLFTGIKSSKYYKSGVLATGTYKEKFYKDGALFTGVYQDKYYSKGALSTGVYKSKYYKNGVLATGTYKDKYYKNGVVYTGYHVTSSKLYKGASIAKGTVQYEDLYYINGILAELVTFDADDAYGGKVTLKDSKGKVVSTYKDEVYLLTSGTYKLTVTANGYATYTKTIKINAANQEESISYSMNESGGSVDEDDESIDDDSSYENDDDSSYDEDDDSSYEDDDSSSDEDDEAIDEDEEASDDESVSDEDADSITYVEFEADDAYSEKIVVKSSSGSIITAKSKGKYQLESGTYTYTITSKGYKTVSGKFTVSGGEKTILFTMIND